jgi:3-oxoacyl-[acyl-carrier-protein] synthase-3
MNQRSLKILGTGKYLPERVVSSLELDTKLGKRKGWVENKSGILKRHFANSNETTSFMATQAARQALSNSNLKPEDLNCIVSACGVMEQAIPSTSTLVQKHLGLSGTASFDINSTCLSFLSALDVIASMIKTNRFENVLIVSSDIPSLGLNWDDMESCTIFGDGAAAAVLSQRSEQNNTNILAAHMETYCKGSSFCQIRAGGTKILPSQHKVNFEKYSLFEMDGSAAYKLTAQALPIFLEHLFEETKLNLSDIDLVIPHQASKPAIHYLLKKLSIPKEKLIDIFSNHGNQVAASIPTALHEAFSNNKIQRGNKILLIGSSAGISLGGMILEYNQ